MVITTGLPAATVLSETKPRRHLTLIEGADQLLPRLLGADQDADGLGSFAVLESLEPRANNARGPLQLLSEVCCRNQTRNRTDAGGAVLAGVFYALFHIHELRAGEHADGVAEVLRGRAVVESQALGPADDLDAVPTEDHPVPVDALV